MLPGPAGVELGRALAAVTAAAEAFAARFGVAGSAGEVAVLHVAAAVSSGRLLSPGWPDPAALGGSTRDALPVVILALLGEHDDTKDEEVAHR